MGHAHIIGWAYEADLHCPACARALFGDALDDPATEDEEGNLLSPLFSTDEGSEEGDYCGDCGEEINEPWGEPEPCEPGEPCPKCGGEGVQLGILADHPWMRCRSCGWTYDLNPEHHNQEK